MVVFLRFTWYYILCVCITCAHCVHMIVDTLCAQCVIVYIVGIWCVDGFTWLCIKCAFVHIMCAQIVCAVHGVWMDLHGCA